MKRTIRRIIVGVVALLLMSSAMASADVDSTSSNGAVRALFNLHHPETGPFPTDIFTVADHTHNTGRRVNLPYPDCTIRVSDCEDLDVINTLNGFGLQPQLSVPFDVPIDVGTINSDAIFLINLGSTIDDGDTPGVIVGINQIVWDTFTDTLHVEVLARLSSLECAGFFFARASDKDRGLTNRDPKSLGCVSDAFRFSIDHN